MPGKNLIFSLTTPNNYRGKKASSRFTVVSAPYKFWSCAALFSPPRGNRLAVGFLPGLTALRQPQSPPGTEMTARAEKTFLFGKILGLLFFNSPPLLSHLFPQGDHETDSLREKPASKTGVRCPNLFLRTHCKVGSFSLLHPTRFRTGKRKSRPITCLFFPGNF